MTRKTSRFGLVVAALASTLSTGCYRGYATANDLESNKRSPKQCAASCEELGLRMSAFVLVQHNTSACVCAPSNSASTTGDGAAAAAAQLLLEENRREAERAQSLTSVPPP